VLRIATAGACVSIGVLGLAGAASGAVSFGVIFAAMFAYAAFRSPTIMLADVVALERAAAAGTTYGRLRLWGSAGFLASAALVGQVVDARGASALPLTIAALLAVTFFAAWALPAKPDARPTPVVRDAGALLASRDFAAFLAISLLAQIANAGHDLCLSLHLRDRGASDATSGAAWAIGVVFEIGLMVWAEPLLRRFSAPPLLVFALFGGAVRWALIASVSSLPALLALQPLHAISFALFWLASVAYVKERAPARALATAQGLYSAALAAGSVAGMLLWGSVYRRAGGVPVFAGASAVALVAGFAAGAWARARRVGGAVSGAG
jgi:PPP family 3-phenylpropionic acid transporter